MKGFWIGLALGVVVTGAGGIYLLVKQEGEQIALPRKQFFDMGERIPGHGYVRVSGAITGTPGNEVGNHNNYFSMTCVQDRGECDVIDFSQIGSNQISEPTLERWSIQRWTPDLIVVRSNAAPEACSHVIINILRPARQVQYIREPQMENATSPDCQMVEMRLFRWSLEETLWWRDMDRRSLPPTRNQQ